MSIQEGDTREPIEKLHDLKQSPEIARKQQENQISVAKKLGWVRLNLFKIITGFFGFIRARKYPEHQNNQPERRQPWFPIVPGLPANRFYYESTFPWVEMLKKNHKAIRNELKALIVDEESMSQHRADPDGIPGWKDLNFIGAGDWNMESAKRCPKTGSILSELPAILYAGLVALEPGRHISPHYGPTNGIIVCHFGIMNCEGSFVNVDGEVREYKDGELVAFDDTYLHTAINTGDKTRYTLMFFTPHPTLTALEEKMTIKYFHIATDPDRH